MTAFASGAAIGLTVVGGHWAVLANCGPAVALRCMSSAGLSVGRLCAFDLRMSICEGDI